MDKWKRRRNRDKEAEGPTVAPGIDDDKELSADASQEEIEAGDFTRVTKLSDGDVAPGDDRD
ncbi:hypothetical protein EV207_14720 [Scopulibacillus darangshiensis]|uniref:Uncharacterized protein n=1 Tax=Scopulibacillus darangshiensis TaxID=442528 RepID=A0A4R2NHM2_9BACL|nr:hypothetical protein [Scopulibacillus darangshiensis]TCP20969.1 hypothetical protein EV207_14720 [Scopulibacillus darangshiensis]